MKKKRSFLLYLLVAAMVSAILSPSVLFAAEERDWEDTEEYKEETPESYDWKIETNELKKWPDGPKVEAEGAVVMDMDTGTFLYSKNAEAKLYPASITKIMTMLVILENITLDQLDKKVKASSTALEPIGPDSSQIWLSVGEKITVRSALYAIMLASANDASNVMAEYVAGSLDGFVQLMNEKAQELGCINTHFANPHGLHDEEHYTCAHDMALIAQAAYEIPLFRKITKTVEYKIPKTKYMKEDRWLVNHQKMLYEDGEYTYEGCKGGKTGFTDEAWNTLVTYASRDDKLLVSVELRVNGAWKTYQESAELLDYGFGNFRHEEVTAQIENRSLGELAGIRRFGEASLLNSPKSKEMAIEGKDTILVTIPNKLKTNKLVRSISAAEGKVVYDYEGWRVGSEAIRFCNPAFEVTWREIIKSVVPQQETSESAEEQVTLAKIKTEDLAEKPIEEKVDGYMDNITIGTINLWTAFNSWVEQNELMAAVIGMILILLLIPLLVIAYIRDKNVRFIRKEREQEEEERKILEERIDNKSVQEIELEIRAELEKEQQMREKEEQRKRQAEEQEKQLKEMEAVIDKQQETMNQEWEENKQQKEEEKEVYELGSTDQR